ncbi:sigma-70 family RNA polymerase sigma factor [Roseomonas elaeocarpi]|uniref:Sigma-70 family RNA polymerase sigma factor n=1 Tax=Roseomonas elaeocarpi TaxID=907779 RepID=A0ABV6JM81_9PROT
MSLRLSFLPVTTGLAPGGAAPHGQSGATPAQDRWSKLMVAAQRGNGGAYKRLLVELSAWLQRYFARRLPQGEVDDAVQETLLAVHRSRHTYEPGYPLSVWLSAIAKRKWVDQLRALERRAADMLDDAVATPGHEAAVMDASVLVSLLGELRPAQSRVIQLVKLEGYSLEEASLRTGQSVSAVKVNIHRGIARLRTIIMKNADVE